MQVELWCPLLAIIIFLALFIWWCRTDEACCDVEKPCLYRCGCKKVENDEDDIEKVKDEYVQDKIGFFLFLSMQKKAENYDEYIKKLKTSILKIKYIFSLSMGIQKGSE